MNKTSVVLRQKKVIEYKKGLQKKKNLCINNKKIIS